jgi:hypothetical protein
MTTQGSIVAFNATKAVLGRWNISKTTLELNELDQSEGVTDFTQ